MVEFLIKRPIAVTMSLIAVLVLGILAANFLPVSGYCRKSFSPGIGCHRGETLTESIDSTQPPEKHPDRNPGWQQHYFYGI